MVHLLLIAIFRNIVCDTVPLAIREVGVSEFLSDILIRLD